MHYVVSFDYTGSRNNVQEGEVGTDVRCLVFRLEIDDFGILRVDEDLKSNEFDRDFEHE